MIVSIVWLVHSCLVINILFFPLVRLGISSLVCSWQDLVVCCILFWRIGGWLACLIMLILIRFWHVLFFIIMRLTNKSGKLIFKVSFVVISYHFTNLFWVSYFLILIEHKCANGRCWTFVWGRLYCGCGSHQIQMYSFLTICSGSGQCHIAGLEIAWKCQTRMFFHA